MDEGSGASWPRYVVVVCAGLLAVASVVSGGIPGDGTFLAWSGLAGLVAGLAVPTGIGLAVLVGTIAVGTLVTAFTSGWYTGLLALIVASLVVPATAGWVAGYALARAHAIGIRSAVRDPRILGALAGVIAITWLIWAVAADFARNPP